MKFATFISIVPLVATLSFAGGFTAPESSVPTPAGSAEISRETPDLGAEESAEWQKMRAERKQAREQILSRLKEKSSAEKQNIRQNVSKNRNEDSRFEGKPQKTEPRERQPFYDRPDSPNKNTMRGNPPPYPPPWWWGPMPQ